MESETMRCAAELENLSVVTGFAEACADRFGLETKKKFGLLIALEEAFVNICSYAYPDARGEAEISCGTSLDAFVLEIADRGTPFDLLSLPEPDTSLDVMDRPIGGLGVHFIRRFTDDVSYRRENGRNVLRLILATAPKKDAIPRTV